MTAPKHQARFARDGNATYADTMGRAVGLVFDGNIHSLAGDFAYDAALNRAVGVDTAARIAALGTVYRNQGLVQELTNRHR